MTLPTNSAGLGSIFRSSAGRYRMLLFPKMVFMGRTASANMDKMHYILHVIMVMLLTLMSVAIFF
jgi:hypothetical protein